MQISNWIVIYSKKYIIITPYGELHPDPKRDVSWVHVLF